jgi:hypothetical protein
LFFDADLSAELKVSTLVGRRYHLLVLMGHGERDYVKEAETVPGEDTSPYIRKTGDDNNLLPPTLPAAGFVGDQLISAGGAWRGKAGFREGGKRCLGNNGGFATLLEAQTRRHPEGGRTIP